MSDINSYFTFNALLKAELKADDIDLTQVKYYRHQEIDKTLSIYELFMKDELKEFDEEQQKQSTGNPYSKEYLASFVQTPNNETVFVGLYKKIEGRENEKKCWIYKLEPLTKLSEWSGRIFVDYPSGLPVHRHPVNLENGLPILHITKSKEHLAFPGFHQFNRPIPLLKTMPSSWKDYLSKTKGVYLLTDRKHHKLYIGSAYGNEGFWGRWQCYIPKQKNRNINEAGGGTFDEEGGGNKALKKHIKDSKGECDFYVSILEEVASSDIDKKIIEKESSWKIKLNTRDLAGNGLNCN